MSAAVSAPATVDEVVARMRAIDEALPATDGVACFNRMYLEVTLSVAEHVSGGSFDDPAWVSELDVVFAAHYFAAVDALDGPESSWPAAWRPLLAARSRPGIEPVQFALAGMNAHINHDLPLSVVETCARQGSAPTDAGHHADYQRIDTLLDGAERSVRESLEPAVLRDADRHVAAVADLVCNWSINEARDIAWDTALALWAVRGHPEISRSLTAALAGVVSMASRALLVAV